jgi:hypothetical protein
MIWHLPAFEAARLSSQVFWRFLCWLEQIQQRIQPAEIDRDIGLGAGCRFGPEGDGEAGGGHHHQVVGAVTDGNDLFLFQAEFIGQAGQVMGFGSGIDNVADDPAGELAATNFQLVRGGEIEAEFDAQALGEIGETAGENGGAQAGLLAAASSSRAPWESSRRSPKTRASTRASSPASSARRRRRLSR